MHPMHPAMVEMVVTATAANRRVTRASCCLDELQRASRHVARAYSPNRPRITNYLPLLVLKQRLALLEAGQGLS